MTYLEYIKSPESNSKMKHIEKEGGVTFKLNDIYSKPQMQKLCEIQNLKEYFKKITTLNRDVVFHAFEEDFTKAMSMRCFGEA